VLLARRGHDRAFEELVRRRQRYIRGLLRRVAGDRELADDLAQETFFQAWRQLHRLRAPEAFGAWLRQIAVNLWLRHARRKQIPMGDLLDERREDVAAFSDNPIRHYDNRLDSDAALDRLGPAERLCIVLGYVEGLSHTEISGATGLPLGTVKSHISRATTKLRAWLEQETVKR